MSRGSLSKPMAISTYKRDRLSNPDRLFFDIVDARPNVGGLRFSTRQVNDRLLKQIRIAETLPGRTRVVLDLTDRWITRFPSWRIRTG